MLSQRSPARRAWFRTNRSAKRMPGTDKARRNSRHCSSNRPTTPAALRHIGFKSPQQGLRDERRAIGLGISISFRHSCLQWTRLLPRDHPEVALNPETTCCFAAILNPIGQLGRPRSANAGTPTASCCAERAPCNIPISASASVQPAAGAAACQPRQDRIQAIDAIFAHLGTRARLADSVSLVDVAASLSIDDPAAIARDGGLNANCWRTAGGDALSLFRVPTLRAR